MSQEQHFDNSQVLLSTTDLKSHIKYANNDFCKIAGYSLEEMRGKPHNLVRHSDMPKAAFENLWSYIKTGKTWMGPVKNRCKNGDFYWVNAFVTPIKNDKGEVVEYQSVRTKPKRDVVERAEKVYQKLNNDETPWKLKFQTDITQWTFIGLLVLTFLPVIAYFVNDNFSWINILSFAVGLVATLTFAKWRTSYKTVVAESKAVFDNSLMSYIYSGCNDDIGAVCLALRKRRAELRAVLGRVANDSYAIIDMAEKSSDCGNDVSKILGSQKTETDQVATAITEMSATIQEIAQNLAHTSSAAQQGQDLSQTGQQVVSETIQAIDKLSSQLSEVDLAIKKLTDGSKQIESVLGEISSIADQTNLLALNAAIEAARAGDQGRGFAVVAEEVRALAMRTQQSTEEISTLLTSLQQESTNVISAMDQGNKLANSCVNYAGKADDSLQQINSEVVNLADLSTQIATAVEEQATVADELNKNIVAITDMSAQTELRGQESVELSSMLVKQLHEQKVVMNQFL